ncbi:unnamed protein product [Moneuplotes crassus]|uniref:Uncharacterized protein n=1 Tax=Euplotes crassus TaxID=5936 RepID=A0AAD1Y939_EUPCR|nr:unnamed protein product [Moneuplotes crassus]
MLQKGILSGAGTWSFIKIQDIDMTSLKGLKKPKSPVSSSDLTHTADDSDKRSKDDEFEMLSNFSFDESELFDEEDKYVSTNLAKDICKETNLNKNSKRSFKTKIKANKKLSSFDKYFEIDTNLAEFINGTESTHSTRQIEIDQFLGEKIHKTIDKIKQNIQKMTKMVDQGAKRMAKGDYKVMLEAMEKANSSNSLCINEQSSSKARTKKLSSSSKSSDKKPKRRKLNETFSEPKNQICKKSSVKSKKT